MSDTITITGNIATVPEEKTTPSGVRITTFRLASSQRRFDRATNQWVDGSTNWYTISAFRALAEHAFLSLRKGERIIVTGRLKLREWETSSKKGTTAEVDADAIGHDLLWGTSVFSKRDSARGELTTPDPGAQSSNGSWPISPISGRTEEWPAPMTDSAPQAGPERPRADAELVDAPF